MKVLLDDSDLCVKSIGKDVTTLTFDDLCQKAQEAVRFVGGGVFFQRDAELPTKFKIIYATS